LQRLACILRYDHYVALVASSNSARRATSNAFLTAFSGFNRFVCGNSTPPVQLEGPPPWFSCPPPSWSNFPGPLDCVAATFLLGASPVFFRDADPSFVQPFVFLKGRKRRPSSFCPSCPSGPRPCHGPNCPHSLRF